MNETLIAIVENKPARLKSGFYQAALSMATNHLKKLATTPVLSITAFQKFIISFNAQFGLALIKQQPFSPLILLLAHLLALTQNVRLFASLVSASMRSWFWLWLLWRSFWRSTFAIEPKKLASRMPFSTKPLMLSQRYEVYSSKYLFTENNSVNKRRTLFRQAADCSNADCPKNLTIARTDTVAYSSNLLHTCSLVERKS